MSLRLSENDIRTKQHVAQEIRMGTADVQSFGHGTEQDVPEYAMDPLALEETRPIRLERELALRPPHLLMDVHKPGAVELLKDSPIAHKRLAYVEADVQSETHEMDNRKIQGAGCKNCSEIPKNGVCLSGYLEENEVCSRDLQ